MRGDKYGWHVTIPKKCLSAFLVTSCTRLLIIPSTYILLVVSGLFFLMQLILIVDSSQNRNVQTCIIANYSKMHVGCFLKTLNNRVWQGAHHRLNIWKCTEISEEYLTVVHIKDVTIYTVCWKKSFGCLFNFQK